MEDNRLDILYSDSADFKTSERPANEDDLQPRVQVYNQQSDLYWIIDHEQLVWAPGVLVKDFSETQLHVQCIVDEEFYAIERPYLRVSEVTLEARENLCDLLAESNSPKEQGVSMGERQKTFGASILHTLRQRYQQSQVESRIGLRTLLSLHHESPKRAVAQYFFE